MICGEHWGSTCLKQGSFCLSGGMEHFRERQTGLLWALRGISGLGSAILYLQSLYADINAWHLLSHTVFFCPAIHLCLWAQWGWGSEPKKKSSWSCCFLLCAQVCSWAVGSANTELFCGGFITHMWFPLCLEVFRKLQLLVVSSSVSCKTWQRSLIALCKALSPLLLLFVALWFDWELISRWGWHSGHLTAAVPCKSQSCAGQQWHGDGIDPSSSRITLNEPRGGWGCSQLCCAGWWRSACLSLLLSVVAAVC